MSTANKVCKLPLELRSWLGSLPPWSNLCSVSRIAAARLVFNLPKFSHVSPIFCDLHWLPVVACLRFKTMALSTELPMPTPQVLVRPHTPAQALCSTTSAGGMATAISQRSHNKVTTLLCFGTAAVERAPCRGQDCRVAHQSQDSLVQGSPGLCIASIPYPIAPPPLLPLVHKTPLTHTWYVCTFWHLIYTFIVGWTLWHLKIVLIYNSILRWPSLLFTGNGLT